MRTVTLFYFTVFAFLIILFIYLYMYVYSQISIWEYSSAALNLMGFTTILVANIGTIVSIIEPSTRVNDYFICKGPQTLFSTLSRFLKEN